jgi:hypothetical protein
MSGDDMPDLREEIGENSRMKCTSLHGVVCKTGVIVAAGPVAAFIKDSDAPPTVIIDTDPGIDDSMALLLAFAAHKRGEIKIIGITIVHGNNNDIDMLARWGDLCASLFAGFFMEETLGRQKRVLPVASRGTFQ